MSEESNQNTMTKLEWGVVFSILASTASLIFTAGVVWTTVQEHSRDIAALKASDTGNIDRLARIETKLDILLVGKPVEPKGGKQ